MLNIWYLEKMEDIINIKQEQSTYECTIKCSDKVKSFKVEFDPNSNNHCRVAVIEVELKD